MTGMRKLNVGDIGKICRLEVIVKPIAIVGDRWWPQTAQQDWRKKNKKNVF